MWFLSTSWLRTRQPRILIWPPQTHNNYFLDLYLILEGVGHFFVISSWEMEHGRYILFHLLSDLERGKTAVIYLPLAASNRNSNLNWLNKWCGHFLRLHNWKSEGCSACRAVWSRCSTMSSLTQFLMAFHILSVFLHPHFSCFILKPVPLMVIGRLCQ